MEQGKMQTEPARWIGHAASVVVAVGTAAGGTFLVGNEYAVELIILGLLEFGAVSGAVETIRRKVYSMLSVQKILESRERRGP